VICHCRRSATPLMVRNSIIFVTPPTLDGLLNRHSNCFAMHLLDLFSLLQGFSGLKPPLLLDCLLAGFSFRTDFFADFLLASFVRAVSDIDPYTSLRKDAPSILGSPVNPLLAFLPTFCIFFCEHGVDCSIHFFIPWFSFVCYSSHSPNS
jgi:hypothetical protein